MPETSCRASAPLQRSSLISTGVRTLIQQAALSLSLFGAVVFGTEAEWIFHLHLYANILVRRAEGK